ncbi:roundabout homolog 2-like [Oratosquilla oratoria]|uniref:roundabout homolog 2-like n=1 Tax=Oratosquilla oratoria TaxID=337810 RepID=UPI003F77313C
MYGTEETPPATLTVLVSPHLVSSSESVTGGAGATVELVCRVGGDPPPEVFWHRVAPATELPLGRMDLEESSQILRVYHLTPEDQGVYTCHAENPVGSVSANITLTVHSRPLITVTPVDARVGVNGTATFECATSGSPPPTTYWTHEGSGVVVGVGQTWGGGRVSVDAHNTLTIRGVTRPDEGYYVCTAVGVAGSALARAHLEVQAVDDMPPPIIALGALNQTLPLDTEGELPCEASGTPEPKVTWEIGGKPIVKSGRISVTPLGTLRITDLKASDTAIYTCIVTSEAGKTTLTAALVVAKPTNPNVVFFKMKDEGTLPEAPGHITVINVNTTRVTLGFRRGRPGLTSLVGYVVQQWSPDLRGEWSTSDSSPSDTTGPPPAPITVTVTNLEPDTRYVFVIRAQNSQGLSRPSPITHTIRTLPADAGSVRPLHEIRNRLSMPVVRLVTVEPMSATAVRLTWQLLVESDLLEGLYVRYRPLESQVGNPMGALSVETVGVTTSSSSLTSSTYIVTQLRPATWYEVFVVPFFRGVEGQPSAAVRASTMEDAPGVAPQGLHYTGVNSTTARITWDPIPPHLANGRITGYNIQVTTANTSAVVHLNTTVNGTWTIVPALASGVPYHVAVRGVTARGPGPLSLPITLQVGSGTPVEGGSPRPGAPPVPATTLTHNTYFIIGIVVGAVVLFAALTVAVICVYRRRRNNKCPQYYGKGEGSGPWSEYPGCWGDAGVGMTGTLYTDVGSHGAPLTQLYHQGSQAAPSKAAGSTCDGKGPEDVYEDPDAAGLRLVSFTGHTDQRCTSPEPYATTPLITDMFRGPGGNRIPPNIPVTSPTHPSPSGHPGHVLIQEDGKSTTGTEPNRNTHRSANYNTHSEKGGSGVPVLQFPPPPPPLMQQADNSSDNTLASTGSRALGARVLLQQLPYSVAGSSSGGSHMSHGSPLLGPRPPRAPTRTTPTPTPHLVPIYQTTEPIEDLDNKSQTSTFKGGMEKQIGNGIYSDQYEYLDEQNKKFHEHLFQQQLNHHLQQQQQQQQADRIVGHHSLLRNRRGEIGDDLSTKGVAGEGEEVSDVEWYSQPLLNGRPSPESSVLGDAESEDESECSSGGSCCSDHHPLSQGHNINWTEALQAAGEARWGRGESFCSTDESTYMPSLQYHTRPARQCPKRHAESGTTRPRAPNNHILNATTSVTSPLV